MSDTSNNRRKAHQTRWAIGLAVLAVALVLLANVRMLQHALHSTPECIEHERVGEGDSGQLAAAKSAC